MAEQNLADYYSMSTLSPIADYGKSLQKRRAVEKALENRLPMNLGQGVLYDPNSRESSISKEYQNQLAAKRQQEMDLANARLLRKEERDKLKLNEQRTYTEGRDKLRREQTLADRDYKAKQSRKPSVKLKSDLAKINTNIIEGDEILKAMSQNPDTVERWWDKPASFARTVGADTLGNLLESGLKEPEELSIIQQMNSFVAKVRHSLAGANLTKMEQSLGSGMYPNATGISQAESAERIRNMVGYLKTHHSELSEGYDIESDDETDNQRRIRELKAELEL